MCNHFRQNPEAISDWAQWAGYRLTSETVETSGDVWPKRQALVVRTDDGAPLGARMAWGVPVTLPGKRPGTTVTKPVTNLRNTGSPFWKGMLANPAQRCLVPFSRFAEPKPGKDEVTGRPAEHWFGLAEGKAGAFAGVWRIHDGVPVFAFLTCEPNNLVAPHHPKAMPVILDAENYAAWLEADYNTVVALQSPYPSQLMQLLG